MVEGRDTQGTHRRVTVGTFDMLNTDDCFEDCVDLAIFETRRRCEGPKNNDFEYCSRILMAVVTIETQETCGCPVPVAVGIFETRQRCEDSETTADSRIAIPTWFISVVFGIFEMRRR